MTRVHSTWASGANAMPVPGWPLFAASGPSIHRPRMTLMARCSRSASDMPRPYPPHAPREPRRAPVGLGEQQHRSGEAVEEAAGADGGRVAGAGHPRHGGADPLGDRLGVVVGTAEELHAAAVAGEHEGAR